MVIWQHPPEAVRKQELPVLLAEGYVAYNKLAECVRCCSNVSHVSAKRYRGGGTRLYQIK